QSPGPHRTRPLIDRHPPMWEFSHCVGIGSERPGVTQSGVAQRADIPLAGGGGAVFVNGALSYYRHADWLGSSRLAAKTDGSGLFSSTAYTPYGVAYAEAGTRDRSFTGMNQDIVASTGGGVHDFPMRAYSPSQGRWWTPDPGGLTGVDPSNPQSWNRYAYVNGTPLNSTDPLGLCHSAIADSGATVYVTDADGPCPDQDPQVVTVGSKVQPIPMDEDVVGMTIEEIDAAEQADQFNQPPGPESNGADAPGSTTTSVSGNRVPWYKNSCITGAVEQGVLSAGVDAIGRASGRVRGQVADQYGAKVLRAVRTGGGTDQFLLGLGDTSPQGLLSTGLTIVSFVPGFGQAVAAAQIAVDFFKSGAAIARCY